MTSTLLGNVTLAESRLASLRGFLAIERAGMAFTSLCVLFGAWRLSQRAIRHDDFVAAAEACRTLGYVDGLAEIAGHLVRAWRAGDDTGSAALFLGRHPIPPEMPEPADLVTDPAELERRADSFLDRQGDARFTIADLIVRGLGFDPQALGYRHTALAADMLTRRGYSTHFTTIGGVWMAVHDRRTLN